MKEIIPDIDKLFKDAVDLHNDNPTEKVWDAIENNLDKKTVVHITERYNRLKQVAILLLLLLTGITTYLIVSTKYSNYNQTTSNKISPTNNSLINNKKYEKKEETNKNQASESKNGALNEIEDEGEKNSTADEIAISRSVEMGDNPSNLKFNRMKGHSDLNSLNIKEIKKTSIIQTNNDNGVIGILKRNLKQSAVNSLSADSNQQNNNLSIIIPRSNDPISLVNNVGNNSINEFSLTPVSSFIKDENLKDYTLKVQTIAILQGSKGSNNLNVKKKISNLSSRISLGISYSPDLSFNHLKNDQPHGPDNDRHHLKDNEKHSFSYTSGIVVDYTINRHFSIQGGVAISQYNLDNHPKDLIAERDNHGDIKYRFDASCGFGYLVPHNGPPPSIGDTLRGVSSQNNLKYIDIPLSATYRISKGKWTLFSQAGISFNILTSGKLNTSINNNTIKESQTITTVEGLKKYSTTGLIGAGIDYSINKLLSLNFTPTARIALTSINKGSAVKSYPNTLGLSTGIKMHL